MMFRFHFSLTLSGEQYSSPLRLCGTSLRGVFARNAALELKTGFAQRRPVKKLRKDAKVSKGVTRDERLVYSLKALTSVSRLWLG